MPAPAQSQSAHSSDRLLEQVDRIAASPVLNGSEALCNLLKFLARRSLEAPDAPVKEYQIATEVFGRSSNFDPRVDSTVRVQMSRLRAKLQEFYSTLGRDEPILVEIPKGSHAVAFREREIALPAAAPPLPAPVEPARGFGRPVLVAALVLVTLAAVFAWREIPSDRPKPAGQRSVAPLEAFWLGILHGASEPLVVFSNAEFVGRPETGLRYYKPGNGSSDVLFDHYTGVGEVISVHDLDQVLLGLGKPFLLKRGRLLNWDDTKSRDLIFLGSPSENLSLREIPLGHEFRFQSMTAAPRRGDLGIVNLHPAAGEESAYFASKDLPITEDFALVELAAGTTPSQSVLLLAGTTTFGTQGAVEFVCDEDFIRDLLPRLRREAGRLQPFVALLHVKISGGVPVQSEVIALRQGSQ
jgi:hypothetical protein